jgi:hypothetical protein
MKPERFFLFGIVLLMCSLANAQNEKVLFDGKSLDGWDHVGPGQIVFKDGLLKTEGGMGLLWYTREKFGNCVLRVVYKTEKDDSNSGVFVRIPEKPADAWYAVNHGYEIQIEDKEDAYHRTGVIYSMVTAKEGASKGAGQWNTMEITLKGQQIVVTLNGIEITRFDSNDPKIPPKQKWFEPDRGPRPESGYIGLQNHSAKDVVYFKEISVRPL